MYVAVYGICRGVSDQTRSEFWVAEVIVRARKVGCRFPGQSMCI